MLRISVSSVLTILPHLSSSACPAPSSSSSTCSSSTLTSDGMPGHLMFHKLNADGTARVRCTFGRILGDPAYLDVSCDTTTNPDSPAWAAPETGWPAESECAGGAQCDADATGCGVAPFTDMPDYLMLKSGTGEGPWTSGTTLEFVCKESGTDETVTYSYIF